ncbi:MAG: hypothetical protein V4641_26940, partial [Pseudomonadota bacterium]
MFWFLWWVFRTTPHANAIISGDADVAYFERLPGSDTVHVDAVALFDQLHSGNRVADRYFRNDAVNDVLEEFVAFVASAVSSGAARDAVGVHARAADDDDAALVADIVHPADRSAVVHAGQVDFIGVVPQDFD